MAEEYSAASLRSVFRLRFAVVAVCRSWPVPAPVPDGMAASVPASASASESAAEAENSDSNQRQDAAAVVSGRIGNQRP